MKAARGAFRLIRDETRPRRPSGQRARRLRRVPRGFPTAMRSRRLWQPCSVSSRVQPVLVRRSRGSSPRTPRRGARPPCHPSRQRRAVRSIALWIAPVSRAPTRVPGARLGPLRTRTGSHAAWEWNASPGGLAIARGTRSSPVLIARRSSPEFKPEREGECHEQGDSSPRPRVGPVAAPGPAGRQKRRVRSPVLTISSISIQFLGSICAPRRWSRPTHPEGGQAPRLVVDLGGEKRRSWPASRPLCTRAARGQDDRDRGDLKPAKLRVSSRRGCSSAGRTQGEGPSSSLRARRPPGTRVAVTRPTSLSLTMDAVRGGPRPGSRAVCACRNRSAHHRACACGGRPSLCGFAESTIGSTRRRGASSRGQAPGVPQLGELKTALGSQPSSPSARSVGFPLRPLPPRGSGPSLPGQIDIAPATRPPLVIHTRSARAETLEILRTERAGEVGGVLHCFTEDAETARALLDLGFFISFSGIVTFPKATDIQDAARVVPADRLLVETDAPFLAPVPHRGRRNEPSYLLSTIRFIAELRGESPEGLAHQTLENCRQAFRIPGP